MHQLLIKKIINQCLFFLADFNIIRVLIGLLNESDTLFQ